MMFCAHCWTGCQLSRNEIQQSQRSVQGEARSKRAGGYALLYCGGMGWKQVAADLWRSDFPVAEIDDAPAESDIEKWCELCSDKLPPDGSQIKINLDEVRIV